MRTVSFKETQTPTFQECFNQKERIIPSGIILSLPEIIQLHSKKQFQIEPESRSEHDSYCK